MYASGRSLLDLTCWLRFKARGVTDSWLEPFSSTDADKQPEPLEGMDLDCSGNFDFRNDAKSTASSRSTSSFVSANSTLEEHEPGLRLPEVVDQMEVAYIPYESKTANLTLLDLRGSQRLTDKGLLQLSPLTGLTCARLDDCHSLVGRGLLAFSMSHRLHTLSLTNCRRLTDEGIINISHLASMEALSLDGCRCLTDRSLQAIGSLIGLRKLDLSQCDLVSDTGIEHLESVEALEELSLGWCRSITNRGLDILTSQPGRSQMLRVLRLARCKITDDGMAFLGRLSALEELDLNGCSTVGSAGLGRALEKLPRLRVLDVSYCPGIL
jgi:Leucine Rich repeat